jgi:hypothetical protein
VTPEVPELARFDWEVPQAADGERTAGVFYDYVAGRFNR